ncbi:UDP-3-O-(3-hydroxymyristoyl)glucosamine N-acyltransferase [Geomesophilobacter sediminis]|uniref:UDP-3-O-acylglucosamine N-acyltransferase n=1 Tax=Geomesophilobacter sediminis TaxID=2798584 RepID=A0A8J7JF11_9BACT|nr:UDP-3-O-(3-hydroxymyristoyl)glucosamine N-acyltransferase [Geomesophilobacter sediminis]MBJ6725961.1 UDP-3-O-(3-hydroxymyristoyl)glucosamine N-acyltransferase [Geomesophilobacter sediminis]
MTKSLKEIAAYLGGTVVGDGDVTVAGLGTLDDAGEHDLTFLANPKYASKVATTRAAAVILPAGAETHGRNAILCANPYLAFAKLLTLFAVKRLPPCGIMPGAFVAEGVTIGADVSIYPGASVASGVVLGDRVTLHPGVVLYPGVVVGDDVTLHANVSVREGCRIGNRVIIQNGAVIGSDGFGYAPDGPQWYKIPQIGIVVVEDDVEIGANSTVDRAALEVTRIGKGTKIDNLVQVAHNCVIGENGMICSQVGISGSTRVGNNVTLGGQVGVAGHIKIGDKVMIGAKSGVPGNIESNQILSGIPVIPHREWLKASGVYAKLPEMRKTMIALEKRVAELEGLLAEAGVNRG